jgi:hypothetical protein
MSIDQQSREEMRLQTFKNAAAGAQPAAKAREQHFLASQKRLRQGLIVEVQVSKSQMC